MYYPQDAPWLQRPPWAGEAPAAQRPAWHQPLPPGQVPHAPDPWAQPPPWAEEATGPQEPLWVPPPAAGQQSWPEEQVAPVFAQHPWASGPASGPESWPGGAAVLPPNLHAGTAGPAGAGDAAVLPGVRPVPPRRRKGRLPVVAGVIALALVAAIMVFVSQHSGGSGGSAVAGNGLGTNGDVNLTTISVAGIFPLAQETVNGLRFNRVASDQEQNCSVAANGAFASALASQGCVRVVRATFVDSRKQYAVTAGVAALPSLAAVRAVNAARQFGSDVWFTGLDGPPGSGATNVTKAVGMAYQIVHGQFIIFALATYCDGHSPAGHNADIQALMALDRSFTKLAVQPILALAHR